MLFLCIKRNKEKEEEKKIRSKNGDIDYNNFGVTNFHNIQCFKYYKMFSIAVILYSVRYDNA